ncbi:ATP-dependent RNA helicase prh1 [Penicillium verhagenii]|uniref:ATP-dependent RNA helicase prh1 n=1 Tax=Penicillium verhagenii TaxID=1562060 RepID=UPI002544E137|nr:ATP-dependent RNA helicase prh1 [Penicillium verhagenii]KAJ5947728.1 ATP-dependent RNA helicase prh1 [Penicillium verhagenii]
MPEKIHTHFGGEEESAPQQISLTAQSPVPEETGRKKKRANKRKRDEPAEPLPPRDHEPIQPKKPSPATATAEESKSEPKIEEISQTSSKKTAPKRKYKDNPKPLTDNKTNFTSLREKANVLYELRKKLPIFAHADEIRSKLRDQDVMLLVGETGSGKSTQIPQFLVNEFWCRPTPAKVPQKDGSVKSMTVGGCIAITQPRRVAAISLARRVAEEMGTPLGSSSPASKVGYSVRFDTSTSPSTRVKFLTEGMLLQEMLHDPWLTRYSAIVVDEVHERGVNVDLTTGFLRNLVSGKREGRGGVPLKVVVMSATADMESLLGFFQEGFKPQPQLENGEADGKMEEQKEEESSKQISVCHIKGRQFPVKTIYAPAPVHDYVDAALKVIFQIHYKEPIPGDILVFLTGQETVEALEKLINEYATGMDPSLPRIQVLPLFAALPQAAQQRVFVPAPPRTRKVILATNIAETSVTVSGVRYVVDCGKAKVKQFRTRLGLDSLLVKPISKSAAIQRKGRAGREAPGQCYRLYTESDYLTLDETNTPEILRCDLSQALLNMKARGVDDIARFPFLTRPPREALEKALLQLLGIDALNETGGISEVGLKIAKLPLTPTLGRVLLSASESGTECLLDAIDIIACLSVENIFLNTSSEEKKEAAEIARRDLYRREGDHLTMLSTVRAYAGENVDRKAWADRHLVSHRAMQSVMDVRKQLRTQCRQAKLLPRDDRLDQHYDPSPVLILQSFLRGFANNTARLVPDGSYRTVVGNQTVAIHPSSVLFGKKVEAIMYNEFVFTNRSYARGVSAVQMDWVGEALAGQ